ncbi:MAG TPA: NrfD/PsrC family molybdoenzyme membrane anchor subunit [Candidatus Acidoferrum sp.]|nr:NrfD/PsrC family molybdoenzyme membrane anchor subunit [Candidatus Acidoferrum sp.]
MADSVPIEDPGHTVVGTGVPPIIAPGYTFGSVTDKISAIVLARKTPLGWYAGFGAAFFLTLLLLVSLGYLVMKGIGIWGNNIPVGWAFDITNFVWWIGIGHAGTLISAILLLLKQTWRTSINRFAEAMTLFAVACAGLFPLIHTGRPWMAYYMFPYPSTMGVWPQFRSPLIWDVFAVSTYGTVSLLFWFVGLLPDLATLRDRAKSRWQQVIFGMLSMGWRGSARHWHRYQVAYLLLAGLATPLVLSVHTVVSFDFATGIVPGWHTTIFPPYFVAGAIYSGFAMVLTLAIPMRKAYGMEGFITLRHLEQMAKVMLATGLIVAYGYFIEFFMAFYSGNKFDVFLAKQRLHGPYAPFYYALILCNILTPQLLWFKKVRRNIPALFVMSLIINTGMWLERFVIVVISLTRDFMPSAWGRYSPTVWDYATFVGTLGLFTMLIFLFVRGLPAIAISEMRELVHEDSHGSEGHQ